MAAKQTSQISIDLKWKSDKMGKGYLVCTPDIPIRVKLDEVVMIIFPNDRNSDDIPQLIIKGKLSPDELADRAARKRSGNEYESYEDAK